MTPLTAWQNFYVILGSAAAALTGLQFISMALIADMSIKPGEVQSGEAFATPAVIHFVAVLLLAASMVAPWRGLRCPSILWIATGALGAAYILFIAQRMRHQTVYKPVAEDWVCRAALPFCDYLTVALAAAFIPTHPRGALFALAAAITALLLIAIHHAWDNVTYLVIAKRHQATRKP
jgi:hypothetical protein